MGFKVEDGQTFLFQGDSITDCDRRNASSPYGWGYAKLFIDMIIAKHPERNINFVNKAISGNTVRDLNERWEDDAINIKPDWLSVLIGINDIHRILRNAPDAYSVEEFSRLYDSILQRTVSSRKCNIVLLEPFYISQDYSGCGDRSRVLEMLPDYIKVVHEMHKKYDTLLIKTNDLFQEQLKYRHPNQFCPEPVHPHQSGHILIAEALLSVLS